MDGVKNFLTSKTIWGGLIVLVTTVLGFMGFNVDENDKLTLMGYIDQIGVVVGGLLAIYGRVVASKKIG